MTAVFDQVRAIVNAKIEALGKRRENRMESVGIFEAVRGHSSSLEMSADVSNGSCKRHRVFREMRMSMHLAKALRLPEELQVPSVEPRPPNLKAANLSFAARLVIAVRDKFGGDAPKVYTAANVSRQAYSQIVSDETRSVSKRTAIRFAFALKSTPEEARMLLKSAGYAFSNSQTEDFILQACLEVNPPIWDLNAVNQLLKEYRVDFQY